MFRDKDYKLFDASKAKLFEHLSDAEDFAYHLENAKIVKVNNEFLYTRYNNGGAVIGNVKGWWVYQPQPFAKRKGECDGRSVS